MQVPVNFDSVGLDGLFSDWLCALREHAVEALVVLGPDPFGAPEARHVLVVHPPLLAQMATALADSRDFGSAWRESDAPLVAWQHIAKADPLNTPRWRRIALGHGYQTLVRVSVTCNGHARTVAGSLFSGTRPRVVEVQGMVFEAELDGPMLFVRNRDQPGFIGALGRALGDAGVNIASFHLGRAAPGEDAICLVQVDQPIGEDLLAAVRALPHVVQAKTIRF